MSQFAIQNVRLSFPSLEQPAEFDGVKGKYEASFIIDPKTQSDIVDKINAAKADLMVDKINPTTKKPYVISPDKVCLKDFTGGDDRPEYDGMMVLKASNKKQPELIDGSRRDITGDQFYAGCYVDVIVDLWFQNNNFGKRINANLFLVRFRKDGDAFGSVGLDSNVEDELDTLDKFDDLLNKED